MDFSLIACLQVVLPLLTEAQGLPFVAAPELHGAAARGCFCCCNAFSSAVAADLTNKFLFVRCINIGRNRCC